MNIFELWMNNQITSLMRWTTPLVARMSKAATPVLAAEDLILRYLVLLTVISSPPAVFTLVSPSGTSPAIRAAPGTTWRRRTAVSASLSASRPSKVALGILAKALLVGANTVKGPSPARVSTRPAAFTAAKRVERSGVAMASSAMFLVGAAALLPAGAAVAVVRQVKATKEVEESIVWFAFLTVVVSGYHSRQLQKLI